jgi:flagellar biogenesis protein FliO
MPLLVATLLVASVAARADGPPTPANSPAPAGNANTATNANTANVANTPIPSPVAAPSRFDEQPLRRGADRTRGNAATQPAGATPGNGGAMAVDLPRLALSTLIVIVLIFVLAWLYKRFVLGGKGGLKGRQAVRVIGRTMLEPRKSVLLLHVGRRVLVVGDTGTQMSSLGEITDPEEVALLLGQTGAAADVSERELAGGGAVGTVGGADRAGLFDDVLDRHASRLGSIDETAEEDDERPQPPRSLGASPAGSAQQMKSEIGSLLDRVKLLSNSFKRPQ